MTYHHGNLKEELISSACKICELDGHDQMSLRSIAKEANVKMLLMGHFSTRYKNLEKFKTEASYIFNNSHIAIQGNKYNF